MAQSVKHATVARKVLASSLGQSLLFDLDQNLGTNASCERIEKKPAEACDETLACVSVIIEIQKSDLNI